MLLHPLEIRQWQFCCVGSTVPLAKWLVQIRYGRNADIRAFPTWLAGFNGSQVRGVIALQTALGGLLVKNFHTPHLACFQFEVRGEGCRRNMLWKGTCLWAIRFDCCMKIFHHYLLDSSAFSSSERVSVCKEQLGRLASQILFRLKSVHLMDIQ